MSSGLTALMALTLTVGGMRSERSKEGAMVALGGAGCQKSVLVTFGWP